MNPCHKNNFLNIFKFFNVNFFFLFLCLFSCSKSQENRSVVENKKYYLNDTIAKRQEIKLTSSPVDLEKELDAQQLSRMVLWSKFDIQKYLMAQGFEFQGGGKRLQYLAQVKEFGFPENIRDSIVFDSDISGGVRIVYLVDSHYNYSDEQRSDVFDYQGDPRLYPDPLNAKNVEVSYKTMSVKLFCDNKSYMNDLIQYIESKGCIFQSDVAQEALDNELDRIVPDHRRGSNRIDNICFCSESGEKLFNRNIISQGVFLINHSPRYYLFFSSGSVFQ